MERRPAVIRKSDLTPAFDAAFAAGWDEVSVDAPIPGGDRMKITARRNAETGEADMTPLEKWKADRHGG
ncbi:hypothetical protein [Hasllibacter sp. MH4015]|uniref:hypothetical protein n=1 Tax=Hasllibacter sp. MH4015 TaxID=2854029 RepID=UPI001CD410BA|nr:hypothetical protein [Hasllibacter sp. MH4015]